MSGNMRADFHENVINLFSTTYDHLPSALLVLSGTFLEPFENSFAPSPLLI
jgi:hypothetical protein